jgi:hypothetical protein
MRYRLVISQGYAGGLHIHGIYKEYTRYIQRIYMHITYISTHTPSLSLHSVYTWYIHCIFNYYTWICIWYGIYIVLFSGFRGTHRPPAPPSHGIEDNAIPRYREVLHLCNLVRFHFNGYAYHIPCICLVYQMYIHVYHMYMSMTEQAYSEYILHTVYPA